MTRLFDVAMAKTAINPEFGDMLLMTKRDRLDGSIPDPRVLRRHIVGDTCGRNPGQNHQVNDDLKREAVSRLRENFRHGT